MSPSASFFAFTSQGTSGDGRGGPGRAGEGPGLCGEVGRGAARLQDHRCSRCCWLSSSASQSCLSHLIFRGWDHFPFTKSKHGNAAGSQHLQRVWVSRKPCTSGRGVPEMSKSEPEQEARGRRAVACTGASGSAWGFRKCLQLCGTQGHLGGSCHQEVAHSGTLLPPQAEGDRARRPLSKTGSSKFSPNTS